MKGTNRLPLYPRILEVTSRGRNEIGRYPLAESARRLRVWLSVLQDRPEGLLLERVCLSILGVVSWFVVVPFSFNCHAMVWPFAFLSRSKGHLPRFASPARGHFLLRQKVTKERPGVPPGPGEPAKGSGLGRMTHGPPDLTHGSRSVVGSTLIYYQRVPTDGARRLGQVAPWICVPAYQRPGFRGRKLVGRIRCFFLRKKAEPLCGKWTAGRGWERLWCLRRGDFGGSGGRFCNN